MIANELFEIIRASLDLGPGCIRDNGTVSIARWGDGLMSICLWVGEGKGRRLHLMYSSAMNMDREIGGEDWLPAVLELCAEEAKRRPTVREAKRIAAVWEEENEPHRFVDEEWVAREWGDKEVKP